MGDRFFEGRGISRRAPRVTTVTTVTTVTSIPDPNFSRPLPSRTNGNDSAGAVTLVTVVTVVTASPPCVFVL